MKKSLPLLIGAFCAALPLPLLAIGVSVSPASLSLRAGIGKEAVARFTVENPSREVGVFEVYPEEFESSFILIPSRFILEAGEKRAVTVRALSREAGLKRTSIAVEGEPFGEPSFTVGGGVRLPTTFEVFGDSRAAAAAPFAGGAVGGLFALLIVSLVALLGIELHAARPLNTTRTRFS